MATRIRLARRGRKKQPIYDIVVADQRSPRDGKFIDTLGKYNPNVHPANIEIDIERALDWVMKGAQPSETARMLLSKRGVMLKKHLQVGVNKGSITQEEADKRFGAWLAEREKGDQKVVEKKTKEAEAKAKAAREFEEKVLKTKQDEAAAALAAASVEQAAIAEAAEEASAVAEAAVEVSEEVEVAEVEEAPAEVAEAPAAEVEEASVAQAEETPAAQEAPAEEEKPAE